MQYLSSYSYPFNSKLIATHPTPNRHDAKLLVFNRLDDGIIHTNFHHLHEFIPKDVLVILNETKVIKARLFFNNSKGKKRELFYHSHDNLTKVQIKGKVKIGDVLTLNEYICVIKERLEEFFLVEFLKDNNSLNVDEIFLMLNKYGVMPLPPYINRSSTLEDEGRYQSIFAINEGSIASPTASLHLDESDLEKFNKIYLSLHIGAGTFFSVKSPDIRDHKMHEERIEILDESLHTLRAAKRGNTRLLAIGTTSARAAEFLLRNDEMGVKSDVCDLYLNPFNPPRFVDHLLTNFHLPNSSLLILLASFIGLDNMQRIYKEAINNNYRFYSYGDAMLVL